MIFLDSGYFIGLMNEKDNHHEDAVEIKSYLNDLNESRVVNTTVLVETLNRSSGTKDNVEQLWRIFLMRMELFNCLIKIILNL